VSRRRARESATVRTAKQSAAPALVPRPLMSGSRSLADADKSLADDSYFVEAAASSCRPFAHFSRSVCSSPGVRATQTPTAAIARVALVWRVGSGFDAPLKFWFRVSVGVQPARSGSPGSNWDRLIASERPENIALSDFSPT
jgi:hypothetical protein